jgi:hypothetical protein
VNSGHASWSYDYVSTAILIGFKLEVSSGKGDSFIIQRSGEMKYSIVALWAFLFMSYHGISAQPPDTLWTSTFGGSDLDDAMSVQQTSDGGYIFTGSTWSYGAGEYDVYLVKTDSTGRESWYKTFGGSDWDLSRSVQQTDDGGYILTGYTRSFGAGWFDVYLIRTTGSGDSLWTRTFGGSDSDVGESVQQTSDGGYIITGYSKSFGPGEYAVYLLKTDASGNETWSKTFGGTGWDFGCTVQQTGDGGYIIAGTTGSFGAGEYDVYLIKTTDSGHETWSTTFGGIDYDYGYSVQQTDDGGYNIAGYTESFGSGDYDVYLVKATSSGHETWSSTFGGIHCEKGYSVRQTGDGGYIVTGFAESFGAGGMDLYVVKTDTSGNETWSTTFGGIEDDYGRSILQTDDGGYLIAGYTNSFGAGGSDAWLIKMEQDVGVDRGEKRIQKKHIPSSPDVCSLGQNIPNPFNPVTSIHYSLDHDCNISLQVYDTSGKLIKTLVQRMQRAGIYSVQWDGTNEYERSVSSGLYVYRLEAGDLVRIRKMFLLR